MPFSSSDLIISGIIVLVFITAGAWLLIAGRRYHARERKRAALWHHEYFHNGGLARALIARWRPLARLMDHRRDPLE